MGDLYLRALSLALVCYATLGRSFAYIGVPPLYVGEILLGLGTVFLLRTKAALSTLAALPSLILLALGAWTLIRTLPFLPVYRFDALRDSVVVLYGAFAFITCALIIDRPERLDNAVRLYGRFAVVYGATAWLIYNVGRSLVDMGITRLGPKPGDVAVHLAGCAVFAILFFKRTNWLWIAMLGVGVVVVGAHSRGGMLSMLLPLCVAVAASRRTGEVAWVLMFGLTAVVAAYLLGLEVSVPGRERVLSVNQLAENLFSIAGESAEGDLDGTKAWRLLWWEEIVKYTVYGPFFWSGRASASASRKMTASSAGGGSRTAFSSAARTMSR